MKSFQCRQIVLYISSRPIMAVTIGQGSFKGFEESFHGDADTSQATPEELLSKNLQQISHNVLQLKQMVANIGSPLDSRDLRKRVSMVQSQTNNITKDTKSILQKYTDDVPNNDKQLREWKIKQSRFREEFQRQLKEYQELQKLTRTKERASLRDSLMKSGVYDVDIDESGELTQSGKQIQAEQIKADDLEQIKQREADLKQLETDIVDINCIFKDLAGMIYEQGEQIDKIEENVEKVEEDIEDANIELKEAVELKSSSRQKKAIIVVLICFIIAAIVAVILGVTLSK